MKKYIGGYAILDLTSPTIYKDALALENIDKPIVVYQSNAKPCFIDTFVIDSDNDVVIINGSLTIASDNTITGDLEKHLYLYNANVVSTDETYNFYITLLSSKEITTIQELVENSIILSIFEDDDGETWTIENYYIVDGVVNGLSIYSYNNDKDDTINATNFTLDVITLVRQIF